MTGETEIETETGGCDCTELCSMGPTCPGGSPAGLPGSGCHRVNPAAKDLLAALQRSLDAARLERQSPVPDATKSDGMVQRYSPGPSGGDDRG